MSPRLSSLLPASQQSSTVQPQKFVGQQPIGLQLVPAQVVPSALGESVHEERKFASAKQHDRAEPARAATALARDSLLDHPAAEIGIDKSLGNALYGVAQRAFPDPLATCETRESLGFERTQSASRVHHSSCAAI